MITFFNFDGSVAGVLPAGFINTATISGQTGNFQVGTAGAISLPNALHDAGGTTGGSVLWSGFQASDQAIQFDQVVNRSGLVMNPLIRMSSNGQNGYGAFINWSTPKIDFVVIKTGGVVSTISSPAIPSYANGTQVTVKLEIQGVNLRFKSWPTGSTEPTTWTALTTDSTFTGPGSAGLSSSGGSADDIYIGPPSTRFLGGFLAPNLTLSTPTSTQVIASWTPATQGGGTIAYQLQRSVHGANTYTNVSGATASPFSDSSVVASASYDYRVIATDGVNGPVASNIVTVTMASTARPYVAGSGQTIGLDFVDSLGNPTNLVSIHSANAQQTLTFSGTLAAPLHLSFNGQTTAAVPLTFAPSGCYGLWTIPVTPGRSYSLATSLQLFDNYGSAEVQASILDGGAVVAVVSFNQGGSAGNTADSTSTVGGVTISWKNLTTLTPVSSQLQVYFGSTAAGSIDSSNCYCDVIRLIDVAAGTTTYFDDGDSSFSNSTLSGGNDSKFFDNTYHIGHFSTHGPTFILNPSAIQSSLQALSNVGAGNLIVTGITNDSVLIEFKGTLGSVFQPLITSSDPAVTIANTWIGGTYPTYAVNGGSPVNLLTSNFVWSTNGSQPKAIWVLPQAAPDISYFPVGQKIFQQNGYGWSLVSGSSPGGRSLTTSESGDTVTFTMTGFPTSPYQIAATWIPDPTLGMATFTIVDSAGTTLATISIDQSQTPNDFTANGFGYKILGSYTLTYPITDFVVTLRCTGPKVAISGLCVVRTSSNTSVHFQPTDNVSLSIPAGYFTAAAGVVPAFSATITNHSGGSYLTSPTTATMGVGYNVPGDNVPFNPILVKSNLVGRISFRADNVGGLTSGCLAINSLGYPTLGLASINGIQVIYPLTDSFAAGKGFPSNPSGYYTILWDGPDSIVAQQGGGYTQTEVTAYRNLTGTTNNCRVYNLQELPNQGYSPYLLLNFISGATADGSGHHVYGLANLRIYPPDPSDPTGLTPWGITSTPPLFHPTYLAKIQGAKCLRFMDWLSTNGNTIQNFTDFLQPGALQGPSRVLNVAVASISACSSPSFFSPGWRVFQVTTAVPHTLIDGQILGMNTTQAATFSDGVTLPPSEYYGFVHVVSPTVIQLQVLNYGLYGVPGVVMTNTITGGNLLLGFVSNGSIQEAVIMCNTVGADMWLNLPLGATDACVTAMAAYVAANLNAGLKVHFELSNETWNYGFLAPRWYEALTFNLNGSPLGLTGGGAYQDPTVGYVFSCQHVHSLCLAAMTAAGRAGDCIRVIGTKGADAAYTAQLLAACVRYSVAFEELSPAPYFDFTGLGDSSQQKIFDLMTTDQVLDYGEAVVDLNSFADEYVGSHKRALVAAGYPNVKVACYEGSTQNLMPPGSVVNGINRFHVVAVHPRKYGIVARLLQKVQDAGASLFNWYYLAGGGYSSGVTLETTTLVDWAAYFGYNMPPGTGNPITDAINITNPLAFDQIKAQSGGAIKAWNALIPKRTIAQQPKNFGAISQVETTHGF